jgi:hypothetical protein
MCQWEHFQPAIGAKLRPRENDLRRLKGGGSQDWPPYQTVHTEIAWSAGASSPPQIRFDVQSSAAPVQKASDGFKPNGRNTAAHRYKLPVEM